MGAPTRNDNANKVRQDFPAINTFNPNSSNSILNFPSAPQTNNSSSFPWAYGSLNLLSAGINTASGIAQFLNYGKNKTIIEGNFNAAKNQIMTNYAMTQGQDEMSFGSGNITGGDTPANLYTYNEKMRDDSLSILQETKAQAERNLKIDTMGSVIGSINKAVGAGIALLGLL